MNEKSKCKLIGTDGNVFAIIGKVYKTLRENGMIKDAIIFRKASTECSSYDEVLQLLYDYVKVE
jgi:hypothetical protein